MKSKPSIVADPQALLAGIRQLIASDPGAALKQLRQLLETTPEDPALLRMLGGAYRKLGKNEDAEAAEQRAIDASTRSPAHREAARAVATGDKDKAIRLLEKLINRDDTDVVALVMLGSLLTKDGQYDRAEPMLRKAVEAASADPQATMAFAEHWRRARRPAEALAQLDRLGPRGDTPPALSLRAYVLRDLGRLEEEAAILARLATTAPRPESYRLRLGHALRTLGRSDEAIAAYRAVLAASPHEGAAWWSLANLKTAAFTDQDIMLMEQGVARSDTPAANISQLHFALGKAFEDRGQTERAHRHYELGNRSRQQASTYRPESISRSVDLNIALFTPAFYAARANSGSPSSEPIFIVGMQRSGSTLVEQILASHPAIEGTAELGEFPALVREQREIAGRRGIGIGEHLAALSAAELRAIGEDYVARTRIHRVTDKPRFTDKMPSNWIYAPLIRLVLPKARIIDVRRHPLACCFANWKQLYGKGLEHSYSMEWMGRYYADYVRLMRHLDAVQPGAVHRLIYDQLVEDVEAEVRRLLDFLELPFDPACLDFHGNARAVRTISAGQVRQPINRKGLDQWKPFEQWLGPLKQALGPVLEDWQE